MLFTASVPLQLTIYLHTLNTCSLKVPLFHHHFTVHVCTSHLWAWQRTSFQLLRCRFSSSWRQRQDFTTIQNRSQYCFPSDYLHSFWRSYYIYQFSGWLLVHVTAELYKNSSGDEIANVNFYAVRREIYWIRWNNAKQRPLRRSRSFKVTDFGTNRKLIYDFLLVINTNLPPILHRFRDIAFTIAPKSLYLATLQRLTPLAEGFP